MTTRQCAGLAQAAGLSRGDVVAFVGAGGKTSAMLALARELEASGMRVIVTTTTMVGQTLASHLPSLTAGADDARGVARALDRHRAVLVTGSPDGRGKLRGLPPEDVERLARLGDIVLVEADGARGRSIKAPASHEPVIPGAATVVCPVVGLDALGRPLATAAHRPELVAAVAGDAGPVTVGTVTAVLTSERGALKLVPRESAYRPILNKMRGRDEKAREIVEGVFAEDGGRADRIVAGDIAEGRFVVFSRP